MSQENQSCLRFSLEESLWFRKGQEVEELLSISLDPDITIQENDQYVTIRGSLELSGEYKSSEESNFNEDEEFSSQKFVERVESREEGNCEFSHRFPVDVTIPNNRIQSIYDIDVLVETFDYSMPERSCLKLSAELTISGLYEAKEQGEEVQELEEALHRNQHEDVYPYQTEEVPQFQTYVNQPNFQNEFLFQAEARKQEEEEAPQAIPTFPTFNFQPQVNFEQEESWYHDARNEGHKLEEEIVVVEEPAEIILFEEEITTQEESSSSSSSSSDDKHKKGKKKSFFKKKSMTLTEFFARKDENTGQASLKMCIVQKGDTVDTLADRYDVSAQHLLRVNNLEINQDIYEGQVLYIPVTYAKK